MARYQTRKYVAISWVDATRMARIDETPLDDIREFPDARLLHRTEWWAYWSDGQLTTAIGLPEQWELRSLSVAAESLIWQVWMSKSRWLACASHVSPQCGWATLADVQDVISCTLEQISLHQSSDPIIIEQLVVEFRNGQQGTLYQRIQRYSDGYSWEIAREWSDNWERMEVPDRE